MSKTAGHYRGVPLEVLAAIDPETLPIDTSPRFTFKYIDISSVAEGKLIIPSAPIEYAEAPSRARRVLRSDDVIMSTVRPNLKAFAHCKLDGGAYIASTGFAVLRAKEHVVPYFLLCSILSDDVTRQIERLAVGSNYPAVNSSDVRRLVVPDLPEAKQRRIANILISIDTAIEKTEALLAKYQQIKAGLMHDLFTRGALPSGQLRPRREQAPALYQETSLGWFPKEWTKTSLRNAVGAENIVNGPFGSDLLTSELRKEGVPVLYVQDVKAGAFHRVSLSHVTQQKADQLAFCNVRKGDILIAKVGSPPCDSCVYDMDQTAIVTQDVMRLRPTAAINSHYVSALLNSPFGRKTIKRISIEGTRERVSLTQFKELVFLIAEPCEQNIVGKRLQDVHAHLEIETHKCHKLRSLKVGLMQDLLTGKVPVSVSEPVAEAVVA